MLFGYGGVIWCRTVLRHGQSNLPPGRWLLAKQTFYGALAMLVQYKAALSTTPPHFMDWTLKHPEEKDTFLAWHCGNGPVCLSGQKAKIPVTCHYMGPDMGTVHFQLKPGIVTLSSLQEDGGHFRMFIANGKSVKLDGTMKGSWSWVKVPDLDKLYRTLITGGLSITASFDSR